MKRGPSKGQRRDSSSVGETSNDNVINSPESPPPPPTPPHLARKRAFSSLYPTTTSTPTPTSAATTTNNSSPSFFSSPLPAIPQQNIRHNSINSITSNNSQQLPSPNRLPSIDFITTATSPSSTPSVWPILAISSAANGYPSSLHLPDISASSKGFSGSGVMSSSGAIINNSARQLPFIQSTAAATANLNSAAVDDMTFGSNSVNATLVRSTGHNTSRSNSVPSTLPSNNGINSINAEDASSPEQLFPSPTLIPKSPENAFFHVTDPPTSPNLPLQQPTSTLTLSSHIVPGPGLSPAPTSANASVNPTTPMVPEEWPNWKDRQIDSYYQIIHSTLPILPSSKVKLKAFLADCPNQNLRNALLSGLNGLAIKTPSPGTSWSSHKTDLLHAVTTVSLSSGGYVSQDLPLESRLVYLVCLIFLFLYTDEPLWLSSAISIAYSMNLHYNTMTQNHISPRAKDSASSSRRVFLVLVILDTMNAAVRSTPPYIPEAMIQFTEDLDAMCFGSPSGVEILKLCMGLRHVCRVQSLSQQQPSPLHATAAATAVQLDTELDAVKAEIEGVWDTVPILKALYHAVLVNICGLQFNTLDQDIIYASSVKMVLNLNELNTLMESPLISVNPLMGYFYHLVCDGACKVLAVLPSHSHYDYHHHNNQQHHQYNQAQAAEVSVLRSQTIQLLTYLKTTERAAGFFLGHPMVRKRMDRILNDLEPISPHSQMRSPFVAQYQNQPQNQHQNHRHTPQSGVAEEQLPYRSPPPLKPQQQPQPQSSQLSASAVDDCQYEITSATRLLQSLRGSPPRGGPSAQVITMMAATSHSALERLANVADKVKLFI